MTAMARDDLAIKNGKITAAKADLAATEKTRDEAKNRYEHRRSACLPRVRGLPLPRTCAAPSWPGTATSTRP